ncbi:PH domain-containing protein [Anaeromyxobacter paludicola]|uniref:Bacterial Pleckstrin homology domain-containing protein n=1 Tax=Anaeromyxobacter paludicola TaxID=2918171 RepID=A0ABM7XC15_9BACT|nr:PH domain-containing protein [Anaeromyxobacter paludicola]BDG09411.1 hypothetical protein AMPC_25240 [Anaeromyxobacter paludicola]
MLAALAGAAAFLLDAAARLPPEARPVALAASLGPLALTALGCFGFAPRAFGVGREGVRVRRWIAGPVLVPLAEIREARRLEPGALRRSIRLFGVGGLFGCYGRFRHRSLGTYRLYASRMDGHVLLSTTRGPVVLTPARPEAFVQAVADARAAAGPSAT